MIAGRAGGSGVGNRAKMRQSTKGMPTQAVPTQSSWPARKKACTTAAAAMVDEAVKVAAAVFQKSSLRQRSRMNSSGPEVRHQILG